RRRHVRPARAAGDRRRRPRRLPDPGARPSSIASRSPRPERPVAFRSPLTPRVVTLREGPGLLAAGRADDAAGEVVRLHVDPAEEARLTGLDSGVVVGRQLEGDDGAPARVAPDRAHADRAL